MQEIDKFGKYQLTIYALITLPLILSAGFTLDYVFTAGEVKYRCLVPECENANSTLLSGQSWLSNSLPEKNCMRYAKSSEQQQQNTQDCANPAFFDKDKVIPCDAWVYDPDELTIHNEWGITCDTNKWKLTLIGTLNNLGQLVGLTFASTFSDRYGRRAVLTTITFLAGLSGLVHSFSVNYWMFAAFEFIDACFAAGIYSSGFIYAMEMTGVEQRILGSTVISCIYAIGEMWLGLAAMWTRNWRLLMRLIYGPGLIVILFNFILPESVRWLLANDKRDLAEKVYRKMARVNKLNISEDTFMELKSMTADKSKEEEKKKLDKLNGENNGDNATTPMQCINNDDNDNNKPKDEARLTQIFNSPTILIRLLICSFCWLTNTFVYYGLSLNSTEFAGNKYVNFILVSAIEIPGNILVLPLLNRLGRKPTLCGAFIFSGIFCLIIQFFPKTDDGIWATIALVIYICGKGCITMAFNTSYVYTTELFPTTLRHSLLGFCSMTGRIGSILAPQTPLLAKYTFDGLPLILFGSMSLTAGLLSLNFPETLGAKLPDTIEEAEKVGLLKETGKVEKESAASPA